MTVIFDKKDNKGVWREYRLLSLLHELPEIILYNDNMVHMTKIANNYYPKSPYVIRSFVRTPYVKRIINILCELYSITNIQFYMTGENIGWSTGDAFLNICLLLPFLHDQGIIKRPDLLIQTYVKMIVMNTESAIRKSSTSTKGIFRFYDKLLLQDVKQLYKIVNIIDGKLYEFKYEIYSIIGCQSVFYPIYMTLIGSPHWTSDDRIKIYDSCIIALMIRREHLAARMRFLEKIDIDAVETDLKML